MVLFIYLNHVASTSNATAGPPLCARFCPAKTPKGRRAREAYRFLPTKASRIGTRLRGLDAVPRNRGALLVEPLAEKA